MGEFSTIKMSKSKNKTNQLKLGIMDKKKHQEEKFYTFPTPDLIVINFFLTFFPKEYEI